MTALHERLVAARKAAKVSQDAAARNHVLGADCTGQTVQNHGQQARQTGRTSTANCTSHARRDPERERRPGCV